MSVRFIIKNQWRRSSSSGILTCQIIKGTRCLTWRAENWLGNYFDSCSHLSNPTFAGSRFLSVTIWLFSFPYMTANWISLGFELEKKEAAFEFIILGIFTIFWLFLETTISQLIRKIISRLTENEIINFSPTVTLFRTVRCLFTSVSWKAFISVCHTCFAHRNTLIVMWCR